jgi:hypothetical protein
MLSTDDDDDDDDADAAARRRTLTATHRGPLFSVASTATTSKATWSPRLKRLGAHPLEFDINNEAAAAEPSPSPPPKSLQPPRPAASEALKMAATPSMLTSARVNGNLSMQPAKVI